MAGLRRTQSLRNSAYFHPHLDRQTKKEFWLQPLFTFFKKRKNKVNFICFVFVMMNLFIIMEFSLKIESIWGLSSVGKFYVLLYCSDVVGALFSLLVSRVSRTILNRVHTSLILVLSLILTVTSLTKSLTLGLEIVLLGGRNRSFPEAHLLVFADVLVQLQLGTLPVPNPHPHAGHFVLRRQAPFGHFVSDPE